jgi:hypothetical protein
MIPEDPARSVTQVFGLFLSNNTKKQKFPTFLLDKVTRNVIFKV